MVEVEIFSGVCGFRTIVKVEAGAKYQCTIEVESGCKHVAEMAEQIKEVNAMNELFKKEKSQILAANGMYIPHITCPVTVGILKAVEVSAELALAKDATITFRS